MNNLVGGFFALIAFGIAAAGIMFALMMVGTVLWLFGYMFLGVF